jgi:hypothetical protein
MASDFAFSYDLLAEVDLIDELLPLALSAAKSFALGGKSNGCRGLTSLVAGEVLDVSDAGTDGLDELMLKLGLFEEIGALAAGSSSSKASTDFGNAGISTGFCIGGSGDNVDGVVEPAAAGLGVFENGDGVGVPLFGCDGNVRGASGGIGKPGVFDASGVVGRVGCGDATAGAAKGDEPKPAGGVLLKLSKPLEALGLVVDTKGPVGPAISAGLSSPRSCASSSGFNCESVPLRAL